MNPHTRLDLHARDLPVRPPIAERPTPGYVALPGYRPALGHLTTARDAAALLAAIHKPTR